MPDLPDTTCTSMPWAAPRSTPRDVVFVKCLPRNATGKTLTRELRRYYG
ncbi:hypothetical protein [Micromonospora sonchi]|nr:hypothetical protein [Micromonospora sonchi]